MIFRHNFTIAEKQGHGFCKQKTRDLCGTPPIWETLPSCKVTLTKLDYTSV